MYCQECGNQIADASNFCPQCGTSQTPVSAPADLNNDEPQLVLKPVFIPWVTILSALPVVLFIGVWTALFFGGFATAAIKGPAAQSTVWSVIIAAEVVLCIALPWLIYTARKRTYAKTEYVFYPDRLEYAEGFWTTENKTVSYKNITEANLRCGIVQRKYGLGTIYLATPATGIPQGRAISGIRIADVPNPEEVYATVQQLINAQP
jgi:membrane protein YdbS with pleckstrin-like domain